MTPLLWRALRYLVYRSLIFFGFVDLLTPSLPFIASLQKMHGLVPVMKFLSYLGTEYFFLALLPVIYWAISRPLGLRLGALLLFSIVVNEIFKVGFAQPRPYWLSPGLEMGHEDSFGFPSGHAQNAFLIWTFLALHSGNRKVWIPLALLLAVAISFSRIFLGVHFPTDVLGGAVIGLVILGLYRAGGPAWMRFWHQLSTFQKMTFAFFACAFLGGIYALAMVLGTNGYPTDYSSPSLKTVQLATSGVNISSRLGALFGLVVGSALTARSLTFQARTTIGPLLLRFIIGFVGLVLFYVETKRILPEGVFSNFVRYALTTGWVVFGAVWVFQKLKINGAPRLGTGA